MELLLDIFMCVLLMIIYLSFKILIFEDKEYKKYIKYYFCNDIFFVEIIWINWSKCISI